MPVEKVGDYKITSTSTERQKRSQNLAPVLVIISGNSLVFSRQIITSTDFYRSWWSDSRESISHDSRESGDSRESEIRVIRANQPGAL